MAWKYSLVIQFPVDDDADVERLDLLSEVEDELIDALGSAADVDGHDFGSGEMNVFVFTNSAEATFERVKTVLESRPGLAEYRAAYRRVDGEEYIVLWPPGLTTFAVA